MFGGNSGYNWQANVFLGYRSPSFRLMNTDEVPATPLRKNAEKSTALLTRLIVAFTKKNDLVMDVFAGTAATGFAALNNDHKFIGCEADDLCHRFANERLINHVTGFMSKGKVLGMFQDHCMQGQLQTRGLGFLINGNFPPEMQTLHK